MRLAARLKGGYYPVPAQAVAYARTLLRAQLDSAFALFDPCAREALCVSKA
jgi:hypothetical protein